MAGNGAGNGNGGKAGAGAGNGVGALGIPGLSFSTLSRVPSPTTGVLGTSKSQKPTLGVKLDPESSLRRIFGNKMQTVAPQASRSQPAQYRTVPEATTGALGVPGLNFAPLSDAQYQAQYGHIGRRPEPAPEPVAPTPQPMTPHEQRQAAKADYLAYKMKHENAYWGGNR